MRSQERNRHLILLIFQIEKFNVDICCKKKIHFFVTKYLSTLLFTLIFNFVKQKLFITNFYK